MPRILGPFPELVGASREERFRGSIRHFIDAEHQDFLATQDPMHALRAYQLARSIGDPPPEWVLVFWDGVVARFSGSFREFMQGSPEDQKRLNRPDEALWRAFNRRESRGERSIWTRQRLIERRWEIGTSVCDAMATLEQQGKPINDKAALGCFLEVYNASHPEEQISLSTAQRDWVRFKTAFPEYVAAARHPLASISRDTPNS